MAERILTSRIASISELKKNPMAVLAHGEGESVAILNRNKPAFYCVPAQAYEALLDQLEEMKLDALADARKGQGWSCKKIPPAQQTAEGTVKGGFVA